jgi:SAM-dependent methyltransferase
LALGGRPDAVTAVVAEQSVGLLGDTPSRDYSRKLRLFNGFARREIREAIARLGLTPGMGVLDAGCGTGEALEWLRHEVMPKGRVVGIDLSAAHVAAARQHVLPPAEILLGDILLPPFAPNSFDLIWCVNTINHMRDPTRAAIGLAALLRPGGRVAFAQSSILPDMYFAWDSRLERMTNEAVHQYYRDRYQVAEVDLRSVRGLVGLAQRAKLLNVVARTVVIERISPLDSETELYLKEAIFRNTWGERLRPYMAADDYAQLVRLCDQQHAEYALHRPDFHFVQTLTLVTGQV